MMGNENWTQEELGLDAREAAELAGLLALADARKPPAALRERVLSSLEASQDAVPPAWAPLRRWAAASGAFAALLIAVGVLNPGPRAVVAQVRGAVLVDDALVSAGVALKPGQTVSVSGDGQAVLSFRGKTAVRLLKGASASYSIGSDSAVTVSLQKGWALNAVKTGTPYSIATPQGRISALGTDYLVKAQGKDTWLCICHGRIGIEGKFGRGEASSQNHGGWVFEAAKAPYDPKYGTLEGHGDEDISSLRAFLAP